jgi:hypothetical protein
VSAKKKKENTDANTRALIDYFEWIAERNAFKLDLEDQATLSGARADLRPLFEEFTRLIEFLRSSDFLVFRKISDSISKLMAISFHVGALGVLPISTRSVILEEHAAYLRNRKKEKGQLKNSKIHAAIVEVRGSGPSERPSQEATRIEARVNQLLKAANQPEVSTHSITRRLRAFLRS